MNRTDFIQEAAIRFYAAAIGAKDVGYTYFSATIEAVELWRTVSQKLSEEPKPKQRPLPPPADGTRVNKGWGG